MTVMLDLKPEVTQHAATQAAARGLTLETYLAGILEELVVRTRKPLLSAEEFEAALDALAEGGENLPVLSEEAVSRAGIYQDRPTGVMLQGPTVRIC